MPLEPPCTSFSLPLLAAGGFQGDPCVEHTLPAWRDCWQQDVVSEVIIRRDLLRRARSA